MEVDRFEAKWASLKKGYEHGSFAYSDMLSSASQVIRSHFRNIQRQRKYGIYIVRQQRAGEILYIGKSGTIDNQGRFKGQDLPGRLTNVKGRTNANKWFSSLVEEKGPLAIEYVFLDPAPLSPALAEATLLQACLNVYGRLPYRNKAF